MSSIEAYTARGTPCKKKISNQIRNKLTSSIVPFIIYMRKNICHPLRHIRKGEPLAKKTNQ